jgi:hypothetical protein
MSNEKYIGLDVHQATISVAVMDSQGKVVMESILETKASTLLEFFAGLSGSLFVTFGGRHLGSLALRPAQAACYRGSGLQSAQDPTAQTGQQE